MEKGRHLDVQNAVQNFLSKFESLARLPFISDSEMEMLYGQEVTSCLSELLQFNLEKGICFHCQDRCCRLIDCELYSEEFSCCPVYIYRPVLCRMHFCNRFAVEFPAQVKDLGDIFLEGLLAGQKIASQQVDRLDSPPLSKFAPDLVADIIARINAVRENTLSKETALILIQSRISIYPLR